MSKLTLQGYQAQYNVIRTLMYDKLMNDRQIVEHLGININTFYKYKQKIQQEDAKAWLMLHQESGQARAVELVNILDECKNLALSISRDSKHDPRLRLEANKVAAESAANIMKIVMEGPTFKTSLPEIQIKVKELTTEKAKAETTKQEEFSLDDIE